MKANCNKSENFRRASGGFVVTSWFGLPSLMLLKYVLR